jgi:chemotaxis protein CheZ
MQSSVSAPAKEWGKANMPSKNMCLDDAHTYLEKIITSLHALDRREKGPLISVLEHLSVYVQSTKKDIADLRSTEGSGNSFSTAAVELEEIVAEASKATHDIMNAAESVEQVCATLDKAAAAKLNDAVTRIYEACAFQDITGQRISKVVNAMQSIETKVVGLARACGGAVETQAIEARAAKADSKLLNGPQLAVNAKSQDEIDKLFDSMN